MKALIDLFWCKYAELKNAVELGDTRKIESLDRELDPLLVSIVRTEVGDKENICAQFQFAIDLLNAEADDRGCVNRNGQLIQTLVARYIGETYAEMRASRDDASAIREEAWEEAPYSIRDGKLLDSISDSVLVVAPNYRVSYSNEVNARRYASAKEEIVGCHIAELVGLHRFQTGIREKLDRCFQGESLTHTYADEIDGRTVVMRCNMSPCSSSMSGSFGALLVIQETADRRRRSSAA